MGYDIHVTRSPGLHFDNQGHEITAEEWLRYVASDSELRLSDGNGPYFAIWSGRSRYPDPWFNWRRGNVTTKNPDAPMVEKAIAIAGAFGARVVGDDGEVYLAGGGVERDGKVDTGPGMDWREW